MKTTLLILSLIFSACTVAQSLQAVDVNIILPNNAASLSLPSSLSKIQACGPDTNGYLFAKASALQALNVNNATSASSIGQYFDAPQSLTISGVSFYGYKIDLVGGVTINATVQIFAAGADSLPTGIALASTTVQLDTNFYAGDMASLRKHATFSAPVTTSNAYVVVISNTTANPIGLIFNSWTALDGGQEWLADVRIGASWLRSYDVNVGGLPFDSDGVFEPHISYSLDANFTIGNQCFTAGNTLTFTNTSSPIIQNRMYNQAAFLGTPDLSYTWNFGDGSPSVSSLNASHTYAAPSPNTVTLTDAVFGWSATCVEDALITIGSAPIAAFTTSTVGLVAPFTNTSSSCPSAAYLWNFGDGGSSTLMNPTYTYATGGAYVVCLTVTDAFGSNVTCSNVTVVCGAPVPGYTFLTSGLTTNFTNTSFNANGAVYLWEFGDGSVSTVMNPSYTYTADGTYTVCLSISDQCGVDSICQTVVIDNCVSPTAAFSVSGTSPTFAFTNSSLATGSTTYSWNFGDGGSASTMDATHTYSANGTFFVTLVVVDSCGGDQTVFSVTVTGVGLDELSDIDLSVFPNPTTGHFFIESSELLEKIEITDLSGKMVYSAAVLDNKAAIFAEELANGAYIISVHFSNGATKRVRIEVVNE